MYGDRFWMTLTEYGKVVDSSVARWPLGHSIQVPALDFTPAPWLTFMAAGSFVLNHPVYNLISDLDSPNIRNSEMCKAI